MSYIGNTPTSIAFLTDLFTGTGSLSVFTMSAAPASTSSILVSITGVVQEPSTYAVSGNTLTFSQAPPAGTGNISVRYLGIPASNIVSTAYRTVTEFTATLAQTIFTVPSYTVGYITVYRNGARLGAADYTATSGTNVILTVAANTGDLVTTESFYVSSVLNAIPAVAGAVTSSYILDGAVGTAEIASGVTLSSPKVAGNIAVQGSTSGTVTLQAPAVAGSTVLTLPAITGNVLTTTSGVAHTVQVFTSGSGTYTLPTNCKAIKVTMVGGGGGGGGGGLGGGGGTGGTSTFGTSFLTCFGGNGGSSPAPGGGSTQPTGGDINLYGSCGVQGADFRGASQFCSGGTGGYSILGGASPGGYVTVGNNSATGSGGGGGGISAAQFTGGGGAAGGALYKLISSPSATYSYAIGAGGTGGAAGTSGFAGGTGGSGVIIVEEYYV